MKPLELKADLSELQRQADELTSLGFEARNIPQSILEPPRALVEKLGDELVLSGPVPAIGTSEQIVSVRFREGGRFDLCAAALRALRDGL